MQHVLLSFIDNRAVERIQKLHDFHDILASHESSPFMKDDPFLLMHSIKSIKDINKNKVILDSWFQRLHSFVLDKSNATKLNITNEKNYQKNEVIDLTGTYNSILRGYAREGQIDSAKRVLQQMHEIDNYNKDLTIHGFNSPAIIDIRTNAYNLVLGLCRRQKDVPLALKLLNQMIESMQNLNDGNPFSSIPLPDDQSFVAAIRVLTSMADMNAAQKIAENLMFQFEESVKAQKVAPSANVHNAYIELLIQRFGHRDDLLAMCNAVINRMSMSSVGVKPDTSTWVLLLKACATDNAEGDSLKRNERIQTARDIFSNMKTRLKGELIDKSFEYMMQCSSLIDDDEKRSNEIVDLFEMAGRLGFVSANVLKLLKQNVSEKQFSTIVGKGRLADKWLVNVTSATVRYTDFTNGGANKHARRKGKSTSNWAKKQRKRIASLQARKQNKIEKKNKKTVQL